MIAAGRALHLACLMAVFGASLFRAIAWDTGAARTVLRRSLAIASFVALATSVLLDVEEGFHALALVRLGVLLLTVVYCTIGAPPRAIAASAGAALALIALTSHAAAAVSPANTYLRAANDAAHLLAAGFWFGGLVALVPEVVPRIADRKRLVALLTLFSRWGVFSVAVLLMAGTADAVMILDMGGMPWSGTYVTLLAIKIVLAGLMVALALTNKFAVLPALARDDKEAEETIPMTVVAELAAAVAIVCIVGVLGTISPMRM